MSEDLSATAVIRCSGTFEEHGPFVFRVADPEATDHTLNTISVGGIAISGTTVIAEEFKKLRAEVERLKAQLAALPTREELAAEIMAELGKRMAREVFETEKI